LVQYFEVAFLGASVQPFSEIYDKLIKATYLGEPGIELGVGMWRTHRTGQFLWDFQEGLSWGQIP
jgi:hypothetical protein